MAVGTVTTGYADADSDADNDADADTDADADADDVVITAADSAGNADFLLPPESPPALVLLATFPSTASFRVFVLRFARSVSSRLRCELSSPFFIFVRGIFCSETLDAFRAETEVRCGRFNILFLCVSLVLS